MKVQYDTVCHFHDAVFFLIAMLNHIANDHTEYKWNRGKKKKQGLSDI